MDRTYIAALLALAACAPTNGSSPALDEAFEETGFEGPFDSTPTTDGKLDADGTAGPRVANGVSTEVWAVTRDWSDVDPEAGMAWGASSGLDWEAKFDAWVASFRRIDRATGYGETFEVTTPFEGRTFEAPTLECAEVALFLRAAFASWYGLPFYIQGWDAHTRQRMYAGHFGFVNADGARVGRFPSFRTSYRDYTGGWSAGESWPSDSRLRGYRLGDDDGVPSLGEGAGAGTYFDEIFLNKRTGYFARLLLLYFGSANLADEANMFHIQPESMLAGDVLLKRWQKRGIGHVMPVMQVDEPVPGRLQAAIASGSMPRRQPLWEEPNRARSSFTAAATGGVGTDSDGNAYAELGGGIRRWRTAVRVSGRWRNVVRDADLSSYIDPGDTAQIESRPDEFRNILADVSPEEQVEVALEQVEAARMHLRDYPASCAARTRREDAFASLYTLTSDLYGWSRERTDAEHRTLEDHVFGELEYDAARTCCWNRSTDVMHTIVMDYARAEQAQAATDGICQAPTVFRAEGGTGYQRWADHAAEMGLAAEWQPWSEDESCAQRDVPEDAMAERASGDFCAGGVSEPTDPEPEPEPEPEPADSCDALGQDDSASEAIRYEGPINGEICADGDEDWVLIPAGGEVVLSFQHSTGDLDLEAFDTEGRRLGGSNGTSDEERYGHDGPFHVRVFGYAGAVGTYVLMVE